MILPHNTDIENQLLMSIILMPENIDGMDLYPEDFYTQKNQDIFSAMLSLKAQGKPIELPLLGDKLKNNAGAQEKLLSISELSPAATNAKAYAKKIKDYSKARGIAQACMAVLDNCQTAMDPSEIIENAQDEINKIEPTGVNDRFYTLDSLMISAIDRITKAQNQTETSSLDIGLPSLCKSMNIYGSKYIVIAGRPGQGKTALMLAMAKYMAYRGTKVGIMSIEMDKEELSDRLISSESGINSLSFYRPGLHRKEIGALEGVASDLSTLPIEINDSRSNMRDVIRRCRKLKKNGCKAIFIDQLSKISFDNNMSEYQGFTRNSNRIAELKKELRIPIFVLCQLNRSVEESGDKRPAMRHLKQTGAIEEDADIIFFIYRPGVYGIKTNTGESFTPEWTEIIMSKCRGGIPGSDFTPKFDTRRGCFELQPPEVY